MFGLEHAFHGRSELSDNHQAELYSTNFYNKVIGEKRSLSAYLRTWLADRKIAYKQPGTPYSLVVDVQKAVFDNDPDHVDGILGPATWRHMVSFDDSRNKPGSFIRLGSSEIEVEGVTIDHSIDLIARSKKLAGKRDLEGAIHDGKAKILAVLHWDAALSARRAAEILTTLGYSSNFGVDNPINGEATVYQWLNPATHYGYHAGSPWNLWAACSFDLSNAATVNFQPHYAKMPAGERPIVAPIHGPFKGRKMLGMYPSQIRATLRVLKAMAKATGFSLRFMPDAGTKAFDRWFMNRRIVNAEAQVRAGFNGVVMHHQIDSNKWDIRCFIEQFVYLCHNSAAFMHEFGDLYDSLGLTSADRDLFRALTQNAWTLPKFDLLK